MNPPLPLPYGDRGLQAFRHLYVHVPFCKHKCGYCDFNAYAGMDRLMPDYVDALERELIFARERHPFQQLETVYLGGGTPSLLPAPLMSSGRISTWRPMRRSRWRQTRRALTSQGSPRGSKAG